MNVKKLKRKCTVKGCNNKGNVYIISKRRDLYGGIIICEDCLRDALSEIKNQKSVSEPVPVGEQVIEQVSDDTGDDIYKCNECGKEFASDKALRMHSLSHKKNKE